MQTDTNTATHKNLVYIEDNPANVRLMEQIIASQTDYSLHVEMEPAAGMKAVQTDHPDLLLLDINLPGMNGYEVLERLRADPDTREIPVIAISANALPQDIQRGKDAGFDGYLPKPIDIIQFLAMAERLTRG